MAFVKSLRSIGFAGMLLLAVPLVAHGETPPNDISHFVKFEVGGSKLRNGDRITIDEVHGTADTIAVGNLYEIKGTYTLASHAKASLAVDVTSSDQRHFPTMNTQSMFVQTGDGHFTVWLFRWTSGNPHISFYPAGGGESFASVYFGTGDSVLRHASWLDDPRP
jgi:hypothetical protein